MYMHMCMHMYDMISIIAARRGLTRTRKRAKMKVE